MIDSHYECEHCGHDHDPAQDCETPPLCPDCGDEMVERDGRFGSFWGCSEYPTCRGTRKSELSSSSRSGRSYR